MIRSPTGEMITPQDLKELAEGMGKVDVHLDKREHIDAAHKPVYYFDREVGVYYETFQPHKDKAQAFEVLEWLYQENLEFRCVLDDCTTVFNGTPYSVGTTLQEAITLAALQLIRSKI